MSLRDDLAGALGRCGCYPGGWAPGTAEGVMPDCPLHGTPGARADAVLPLVRAEVERAALRVEALSEQEMALPAAWRYRDRDLGVYKIALREAASAVRRGGGP